MAEPDRARVYHQDNGARVVLPTSGAVPLELEDVYRAPDATTLERATGGAFSHRGRAAAPTKWSRRWLPTFPLFKAKPPAKAAVRRRALRKAPGTEATGQAMLYGALAFLACAVTYNLFIVSTGYVVRPLTIGCGALIGLAVKQGNKRRYQATNMLYAGALAYLCVASTYVYWFYDELMNPEYYQAMDAVAVADMMGSVWGGTGGVETPVSAEVPGVAEALWTSMLKSLFFPFVLLQYGGIYEIVWGGIAVVTAWKAAAPRPEAG